MSRNPQTHRRTPCVLLECASIFCAIHTKSSCNLTKFHLENRIWLQSQRQMWHGQLKSSNSRLKCSMKWVGNKLSPFVFQWARICFIAEDRKIVLPLVVYQNFTVLKAGWCIPRTDVLMKLKSNAEYLRRTAHCATYVNIKSLGKNYRVKTSPMQNEVFVCIFKLELASSVVVSVTLKLKSSFAARNKRLLVHRESFFLQFSHAHFWCICWRNIEAIFHRSDATRL